MSKKPEEKVEIAKAIANQGKRVRKASAHVETFFGRIMHFLSRLIDRIFFKERLGWLVSLLIAISLFFMVSSSEQITSSIRTSIELNNIEVEVLANDDLYEITGVPTTVNAIVQGEFVDLTTLRNQGNYSVVADLMGLTEGVHIVQLEPTDFSPRVRVALSPLSAEVTIRRKISQEFDFGYDFINTSKLAMEYVLGQPEFGESQVVVQASQDTINQISHVKALIDVSNQTDDFETEARLVAYNQLGETMNIDIIPKTVVAKVEVSSPNKQVPLELDIIGQIPNNQAVEEVSLDVDRITLYGPEEVLAAISELAIPINATTLTSETINIVHSISLPPGIRTSDLERVQVSIKLGPVIEKTIADTHVFFENNINNYSIEFVNEDQATMDVILRGSQSMIDNLDLSLLRVSIDMRSISPGVHEVPLIVSGPSEFVEYETSQEIITIEVKE